MKVIELLNKVANNEEVPEKIQYNDIIFRWTGLNYYSKEKDKFLDSQICLEDLEYPIEIIEEDKKIEELVIKNVNGSEALLDDRGVYCGMNKHSRTIAHKLNEVIKAVNELKKEGSNNE